MLCMALLPKLTECDQLFRNSNSSIDIIATRLLAHNDYNLHLMRVLIKMITYLCILMNRSQKHNI